jgi:hypothetical protein
MDVLKNTAGVTRAEQQKMAGKIATKMAKVGPVRDFGRTIAKSSLMGSSVLKARINVVGNAADVVASGMATYEDWVTDDRKAAVYHGVQAAGGLVSLVGYVMVGTVALAPLGAVLVFVGSAAGLVGSFGGALAKTTNLEKWLKFCEWGERADKEDEGEHEQAWAGGRPKDLCRMVGRQIRTLNDLLIGLQVDASSVSDDLQRPCVEVSVAVNMLAKEASIYLQVYVDGVEKRPFSVWKRGDERGPDGAFRERFRCDQASWVWVRVHSKPFGNDLWYPAKAIERSFHIQASWLHGPTKEGPSA